MKIIVSKKFPPKGYSAISLFGFLIARDEYPSIETIRHEVIHLRQQKETLFILFFLWYGLEYLCKLIYYRNHDKAYTSISFEREAYKYDTDIMYLSTRKRWAWVRFIFE